MMKRNIVLVGMMGSGKSHIGRKLAQRLNWQFVDTDRRIERAVGMTIADFFASYGEQAFRERELNILQQVSRYHEAVISFGGNFPMNVDTYRILHRHGFIVASYPSPSASRKESAATLESGRPWTTIIFMILSIL